MNDQSKEKFIFPEKKIFNPQNAKQFVAAFAEFDSEYPASGEFELSRIKGYNQISDQGLPVKKLERWKYTDLSPALACDYRVLPLDPEYKFDGNVNISATSDKGVADFVFPKQDTDGQLWALNQAFLYKPFCIEIAGKENNLAEMHWSGASSGTFHSPRRIITVKKDATFKLVEYINAPEKCWINPCTQIIVEEGAYFEHYVIQECDEGAFFTSQTHINIGAGAVYKHLLINTGAQIGRSQYYADMNGKEGECHINGIMLLDGGQTGDITINIKHNKEDCFSNQTIKSVLSGHSRGVFQGTINVAREAQKTDAHQLSNSIILNEGAEMDTKPELEIFADDVKCSHGATTGQLDNDALFYLKSRGIPEDVAKRLLVAGFIHSLIDSIGDNDTQEVFSNRVDKWLEKLNV